MDYRFDDLELNYRRFLPANRDAAILDVGCGPGRILTWLRNQGYAKLVGVDRDPAAVAQAGVVKDAELVVVPNLVEYLTRNAGRFDLIVAKDVLYYIPKDELAKHLRALHAALKPDGRIISENFNGAAASGGFIGHKEYRIEWIPTEFSVRELLADNGFVVREVFALEQACLNPRRALWCAVAALWRVVLRLIYVFERGTDPQNPTILTTKFVVVAEATRP